MKGEKNAKYRIDDATVAYYVGRIEEKIEQFALAAGVPAESFTAAVVAALQRSPNGEILGTADPVRNVRSETAAAPEVRVSAVEMAGSSHSEPHIRTRVLRSDTGRHYRRSKRCPKCGENFSKIGFLPHLRKCDPNGNLIKANGKQPFGSFTERLLQWFADNPNATFTSREVADALKMPMNSVSARLLQFYQMKKLDRTQVEVKGKGGRLRPVFYYAQPRR